MGGGGARAGPRGEGGRAEWLRIYGCMAALLRKSQVQVEALLADRSRVEAFVKIHHDFWVARLGLLQAQLQQMRKAEASRKRCETANLELLLGEKERELRCCQKLAELTEEDLEDFITSVAALAAENTELKIKLKEVESRAEVSENTADHEHSARGDLKVEIRKLKQAYKTLSSKKDKEVSALLAEKDFVWNQLRTMEQDYTVHLKNKKIEVAQATEAAQKLQQNVEELQVAAQKKDDEIGILRSEAVDAKKKISILQDKLQEMHSLAKEKDDAIEKLKDGQPETSQKHKYINETHRKSRSEGPALREKSKNNSRRQTGKEDGQPETSQKRKCTSSLSNGLRRCSARLQVKAPVSPGVQPVLFSPNFKVPKLKAPTPLPGQKQPARHHCSPI